MKTTLSILALTMILSACAGNKTEITLTGDNNTINTSAATDRKSETSVDAAGSGYGSVSK